jgi:serine/threonine protein kinase|tara:strand:- start:636 stop:755 length:120 start_codon:yes stop_codon:yes gene_type:complete
MDVLDYMNSLGGVMPEHTARVYFKQLLDGIRCIHAHGTF